MQRNKGKKGYRPKQAQIKADKRKAQAAKALKMTATVFVSYIQLISAIDNYADLAFADDSIVVNCLKQH
jgi:hypothetical protein